MLKRVIAIIMVFSILFSTVPVNAADKYDKLLQQFVTEYVKYGYDNNYWNANKSKLMPMLDKIFREAQGLNDSEWKAFSGGIIKTVKQGIYFSKEYNPYYIAREIYQYGWYPLVEYWKMQDSNPWSYDPDADYSELVISTLTDTLKQSIIDGYPVSDEVMNTLPVECADKINSLDMAPQEVRYVLYMLGEYILYKDQDADEDTIYEFPVFETSNSEKAIKNTLDVIDSSYKHEILEIRKYRSALFFKFKGTQPSKETKMDVALAINMGIIPKNLQENYQKPVTKEEYVSLIVNTIFTWQLQNKWDRYETETHKIPLEDKAITKERYLSSIISTDYKSQPNDNEDIKLAYLMGLINDTSYSDFKPKTLLTRQEAAVMLANYFQWYLYSTDIDNKSLNKDITDFNKAASWAKDSIALCFYNNSKLQLFPLNNKKTINPQANITRNEAIITAYNIYNYLCDIPLYVRGATYYLRFMDYSVNKNTVTAIHLNSEYPLSEFASEVQLLLEEDILKGKTSANTPEQFTAMGLGLFRITDVIEEEYGKRIFFGGLTSTGHFSPDLPRKTLDAIFSGKNHLFDVGWAKVEINGNGFIYKINLMNNGFHTPDCYGGLQLKKPIGNIIR